MIKSVESSKAPAAIGPYSQAISTDEFVFCSGQLPVDPATGVMPSNISDQTRQSLKNVKAVLEEEGCGMDSVVKATVFLADIKDFSAVNAVYDEFFSKPYPARSCFAVASLPKGAGVEIEVIASRG